MISKILIGLAMALIAASSQGAVLGRVTGQSPDCKEATEVFVSQTKSRQLLYQIHVPVNGTFEVKVRPGDYTLRSANRSGCFAEQTVTFKKAQVNVKLELSNQPKPGDRKPAASGFFCPYCAPAWSPYSAFPTSFVGPWWNNFSMMNYPNYSYPCMWGGWGCSGSMYPPGGPIAVGKPNIYLRGPDVKELKVELKEHVLARLIATSPAHMEKGWTVDIKKNEIYADGVKVPYLFYDARADLKSLQSKKGFCGSAPAVLQSMVADLRASHFPSNAIDDFNEYWSYKLPSVQRLCVYPQGEAQLNADIPIEVVGAEFELRRVLYFIVPHMAGQARPPRFLADFVSGPSEIWTREGTPEPKKKKHVAFEWGIAFPFVD